jgi:hypothetical protein
MRQKSLFEQTRVSERVRIVDHDVHDLYAVCPSVFFESRFQRTGRLPVHRFLNPFLKTPHPAPFLHCFFSSLAGTAVHVCSGAIRRVVHSYLAERDFDVCGEAVDGEDAIEKARELKPDLILLDLAMPRTNGIEAASVLDSLVVYAVLPKGDFRTVLPIQSNV